VLVPVARAHVDEKNNRVHLDSTGAGLAQLPRYEGRAIDRNYNDTFGRHEKPGSRDADARRLTRSAEELRIGKKTVQTGEAKVRKHVETEHVSEPVERMREEVHVDRRPVAAGDQRRADIRDDEIRVPITEEELVVEKRPVVKEEVVISKDRVKESENVEADLRKERIDVEQAADRGRPGRVPKPKREV
jgi:uncharacterized protein (TIGR02271 family)